MKLHKTILPALAAALAAVAPAPQVGSSLEPVDALEDFAQTPAGSFDDFAGRAVLIEFFAYW